MLTTLTILGSIGSIFFGLVATITEFRNEDRSINRKAIWVIVGIAVSSTLSLMTSFMNSESQSFESAARHESLLETIWENNNRVEPGAMRVLLSISYGTWPLQTPPKIFEDTWVFSMRAVRDTTSIDSAMFQIPYPWKGRHHLSKPDLEVKANLVEITQRVKRTVDDDQWEQINLLTGFTGDLGAYSNPLVWNGSFLELHFTSSIDTNYRKWRGLINEDYAEPFLSERDDIYEFAEYFDVSGFDENDDAGYAPVPCNMNAKVYIGDQLIASSSTIPASYHLWDEDVRGSIAGKFPLIRLPEDLFPQFEPAKDKVQQLKFKDYILLGICYLFLAIMLVVGFLTVRSIRSS